jgi:SAM-dependent methyltransferase
MQLETELVFDMKADQQLSDKESYVIGGSNVKPPYVLGRSDQETKRLQSQARFFEPYTLRLFEEAGITRGMRVLDLGSGAGDVALLAGRLVGPDGFVLGVDTDPVALETARARALAAGHHNVSFMTVDIQQLALKEKFDAVVGRFILMYLNEPLDALRALIECLRPGGIVAFQECDWTQSPYAVPPSPLLDQVWDWISSAFRLSGADMEVGLKLHRLFDEIGLCSPELHGDRFIGAGADWNGYEHIASMLKSLLPFLESHRILRANEVKVDSVADRLREEMVRKRGVLVYYTLVRGWARKP